MEVAGSTKEVVTTELEEAERTEATLLATEGPIDPRLEERCANPHAEPLERHPFESTVRVDQRTVLDLAVSTATHADVEREPHAGRRRGIADPEEPATGQNGTRLTVATMSHLVTQEPERTDTSFATPAGLAVFARLAVLAVLGGRRDAPRLDRLAALEGDDDVEAAVLSTLLFVALESDRADPVRGNAPTDQLRPESVTTLLVQKRQHRFTASPFRADLRQRQHAGVGRRVLPLVQTIATHARGVAVTDQSSDVEAGVAAQHLDDRVDAVVAVLGQREATRRRQGRVPTRDHELTLREVVAGHRGRLHAHPLLGVLPPCPSQLARPPRRNGLPRPTVDGAHIPRHRLGHALRRSAARHPGVAQVGAAVGRQFRQFAEAVGGLDLVVVLAVDRERVSGLPEGRRGHDQHDDAPHRQGAGQTAGEEGAQERPQAPEDGCVPHRHSSARPFVGRKLELSCTLYNWARPANQGLRSRTHRQIPVLSPLSSQLG